jgi:hypothetical protein
MKKSIAGAILAGLLLGAAPADLPPSTHTEELLDSPGGRPVAVLLPGSARRVVEAKDGYVKVVVEGWIRQEGAPPQSEAPAVTAPPPLPAPTPALPAASVASLAGRIEIRLKNKEVRYGSGARVMLLGNLAELEPRRVALASAYQAEVKDLEAQIAQLEADKRRALNSSENMSQASSNLDQAKAALVRKNRELGAIQQKYSTLGDALVEPYKVAEVAAGPGGEYHLDGIAPGEYRLRAWFSEGGAEYRWYVPASVSAQKGTILDLNSDKAGQDPLLQAP